MIAGYGFAGLTLVVAAALIVLGVVLAAGADR